MNVKASFFSTTSIARQPRIAILTTAKNIGGMERVVCGLSREFSARGWNVGTVFPASPKSRALLQWCSEQGVNAESSSVLRDACEPHGWHDVRQLAQFVRTYRPDVVSLHYGDNFISLKDVIAVRLAGSHQCVVSVYHPTAWNRLNRRKRIMTRLAAYLSHDVVACSQATYATLRQAGVSASKLHLVLCGLQAPARLPSRAASRTQLGLLPDAFIVGSMGRLVPHKGMDDLIKAIGQISNVPANLILAIAGDGPERSRLEQLAEARGNGRVIFLGRVPDVDDFYAACDVFSLPSRLEGFGLVYIEAAFHGVPSIATQVGGIPDAVVDGETGVLVPVGDVEKLSAAVIQLYNDDGLRQRLGQAAGARAYAEFTEGVMAERFMAVLR